MVHHAADGPRAADPAALPDAQAQAGRARLRAGQARSADRPGRDGARRRGGDFFYRFHFELEIGFPWGRWLASIAGMFMLVAIISGVITHKKIFADFFTFRPKKGGQRAWMDGHNALSVLGLPFHLMITFSGLVLFMGMLMPAGILAVYDDARQFSDEVFASFKVTPPRGTPAP
ncbi:PepSY-associated TM helix domain-containing protein [Achromobacter xylosoxidans]